MQIDAVVGFIDSSLFDFIILFVAFLTIFLAAKTYRNRQKQLSSPSITSPLEGLTVKFENSEAIVVEKPKPTQQRVEWTPQLEAEVLKLSATLSLSEVCASTGISIGELQKRLAEIRRRKESESKVGQKASLKRRATPDAKILRL